MTCLTSKEAVAKIVSLSKPVLFLDTCALLDIVRAPVRDHVSVSDIAAVHELLARAEATPSEVSILINEQVHRELLEHFDDVEEETKKSLKKDEERLRGILARMGAILPSRKLPTAIDLMALGFPGHGRSIVERFLRISLAVEDHGDEKVNAISRVQMARPPATRAKQSVKDCIIVETYLRVATELSTARFSQNKVLLSSNTKDYHQEHSSLHPYLRAEFDTVSLEFSPNWSAARHELDR